MIDVTPEDLQRIERWLIAYEQGQVPSSDCDILMERIIAHRSRRLDEVYRAAQPFLGKWTLEDLEKLRDKVRSAQKENGE